MRPFLGLACPRACWGTRRPILGHLEQGPGFPPARSLILSLPFPPRLTVSSEALRIFGSPIAPPKAEGEGPFQALASLRISTGENLREGVVAVI
jgi:hypothetical protein